MIQKHIHWLMTDDCNLDCGYCFRPKIDGPQNNVLQIAESLAGSDITKVTIGGGEPTLVRELPEAIRILRNGGKYVSLHTNGILLSEDVLRSSPNDIALPIDSTKPETLELLRGKAFADFFPNYPQLMDEINQSGIFLGFHTVFTQVNKEDLMEVYAMIYRQRLGYDYWNIYEFNYPLALGGLKEHIPSIGGVPVKPDEYLRKRMLIDQLRGFGTPEKGYTDDLMADFILAEEEFKRMPDVRRRFVAIRDTQKPYIFVDSGGEMTVYQSFSDEKRRRAGNLLIDGLEAVEDRVFEMHEQGPCYDEGQEEDFIESYQGLPLWARLHEGSYYDEELDEIKPEYFHSVQVLAGLWQERTRRMEGELRIS